MADNNILAYGTNSLLIGLVVLGMFSFYILTVNGEGRGELFSGYPEIEELRLNLTSIYQNEQLIDDSNINFNLTASYNPELAISAADQSGTAIGLNLVYVPVLVWNVLAAMGSILFGTIFSTILSGVFLAILGYYLSYYVIKWVRTGI